MAEKENIVRFPDAGAIEAEAAEWLVRLDCGTLSGEDYAAYREWLARSPAHRDTFARLSVVWSSLDAAKAYADPLPGVAAGSAEPVKKHRGWHWKIATAVALVLVLAGGGLAYWNWPEPAPVVIAYETPVGAQRTVTLADGTSVLLNTASRIEVAYSRKARDVRLVRGEAYFEVVHDNARLFTVISGIRQVRDLGTAFAVRESGKALEVTVAKGAVELVVAPAAENAERVGVLNAGQSAAFDRKLTYKRQLSAVELNRQISWRDGVLVYAGEPLAKVVADFSRYTNVKIELADPHLADLPVGGYFEVGKLPAVLEALESNFGVHVTWVDQAHVRLSAAHRVAQKSGR
jgi:transmembrane sensor